MDHQLHPASRGTSTISARVFTVPGGDAGTRLDIWLTRQAGAMSRSRIQSLIHEGHATVNGRPARESYKVHAGDSVRLAIPPPVAAVPRPEAILLDILFEDADLLVLNKPAGLVVHPAAGHHSGTLVNALLHHCGSLAAVGGELRPGIVHRLDRDTSGIMVVAKNDRAAASLMNQFKQRTIRKNYVALVWGRPTPAKGTIKTLIGRHRTDRKKMSVQPRSGRAAVTYYELSEQFGDVALVRIRLETGRTHQIRVHMAHCGHPVVGDAQYGKRPVHSLPSPVKRQMLHAETLCFAHPGTGRPMDFTAPWPADLQVLVTVLRQDKKKVDAS